MKTFTKVEKTKTLTMKDVSVDIFKFVKDGTKREFWTVERDGKRLTKTMFARLGECETATINYLRKATL